MPPPGAWERFRQTHLHDYPPAALRWWLAIAGSGALALGWALLMLATRSPAERWLAVAGIGAVALAALFSVHIPRTRYSVSASDVFIFTLLAGVGPAAAVLAIGVDGYIGTRRTSRRLSSHVASPSAAMASMAIGGLAFEGARHLLVSAGLAEGLATLAALCGTALVPFILTTLPLMAMMAAKGAVPMQPLAWLGDAAWVAAVYLGAALVAGLLHLNAALFGHGVLVVAGAAVLGLALLLRVTLQRREAERRVDDARIAEAEREAALSQQRFTAAFDHAAIGMAIVGAADGRILQANRALAALLGVADVSLPGRPFAELLHAGDVALFQRRVAEAAQRPGGAFSIELRCAGAADEEVWVARCTAAVSRARAKTGRG